jgi:hypothetical protein
MPVTETMSSAARARLDEFYCPHNARLAEQLAAVGVASPAWLSEGA